MEIAGYIASICIGLVLGILGGGGSILSIPILVYLFHIDAVLASAYSLFIVGFTSLVGAVPKYVQKLQEPTGQIARKSQHDAGHSEYIQELPSVTYFKI